MPADDDRATTTADSEIDFAESLTGVRLKAGLSVRQVARVTGIPSGTLGGYFSGRHLPPVNRPEVLDSILGACGADADVAARWRERLVDLHRRRRSALVLRPPYRGLTGFGFDDHDLFFGREELVVELRNHVERIGSGVVVVVGPSGTGKSSLLRAGLLPALADSTDGSGWVHQVVSPGDDPAETVDGAIERLSTADGRPALLVVDQFEELFTLTDDEDQQATTVDRLVRWTEESTPAARVLLIGLRADHYGDAAAHAGLVAALRDHQVLVPPMTDRELRTIIERPAEQVGLRLEWGLTDVMLADVRASDITHVLPHLSHTLVAMWDRSDHKLLRIKDYKSVGGVAGAVRGSAERAFAELDADRQDVARTVLLQLVTLSADAGPSRRSRSREELSALHPDAAEVLDYLIAHRLVAATETEVSLSHESLIEAWPRLRRWLDEDRSGLLLRELLGRQERTWREHDRDPELLLRGSLLETVREWRGSHPALMADGEEEYVAASETVAAQRAKERHRQHRRTQRLLVVAVTLALVAVLTTLAALQSRSTAAAQRDEARSRQLARVAATLRDGHVALANQVALRGFQIAPTRESRSALVDATALPTMTRRIDDGGPLSAAANSAGDLVAFGGSDGQVDLVRVDGQRMTDLGSVTLGPDGISVQSVAFGPEGSVLAVAGGAPDVRLFDVSDPQHPALVAELPVGRTVFDLGFSADGRWLLAAADEDADGAGAILLWESVDGTWVEREPFRDVDGSVRGLTVSDDGSRVAAATMAGQIYLWSFDEARLTLTDQARVGTEATRQFDVALSPDSTRLAAVGSDQTLRLFALSAEGELGEPSEMSGFASWVNSVAFTQDGRHVLAGGSDSSVRVWEVPDDPEDAPRLRTVLPVSAAVTSVNPVDDRRMVITTTDPTSYLWDREAGVLPLHDDTLFVTRASADGTRSLTAPGTGDGALHLWDTSVPRDARPLATVRAPEDMGVLDGAGAISSSGTTIVGGTSTGYVVSWDVADPRQPRLLGGVQIGSSYVDYVSFFDDDRRVVGVSNDARLGTVSLDQPGRLAEGVSLSDAALSAAGGPGSLVATGGTQGGVTLWDGHDLSAGPVGTIDVPLAVFALDFDRDVLAVGGANNQVQLFDVSSPSAPEPVSSVPSGPAATVYSLDFSPDRTRLAAATLDGSVWIWHRKGAGFASELVLQAPNAGLNAVGWVDNGHVLAGGHEGRSYLWTLDPDEAADIVCGTAGSAPTQLEWTTHLPGIDYQPPCAADGS